MTALEQGRITEALSRNQTNLEILATLQKLIRNTPKTGQSPVRLDLGPLEEILSTLTGQTHMHPLIAYDFEFQRVEGGRLMKIKAIPTKLTED